MLILGLESSCDDCSAAVVEESAGGPRLLSLIRKSQDELHAPYGGVVPELAAREHLVQLRSVIRGALGGAGIKASDLSRVAVTQGPGLIGCLLTTFCAAKAIAWRLEIPFVGVHHVLGHLHAARLANPRLPFPALFLLVSGGHTHLYLAKSWIDLTPIMKTRDDAAGEAFDKTARMLNLGYPGGAIVDACAQLASKAAPAFKRPKFRDGKPSWSFSGLKTAVKQRIESAQGLAEAGAEDPEVRSLCKTINETIASWLLEPIPGLASAHGAASLVVAGGVACNSELRSRALMLGKSLGIAVAMPEAALCTDNGAMVAAAGAMLPAPNAPWGENAEADLQLAAGGSYSSVERRPTSFASW
jgi:N6-L-threonylcarbamoyladenine synthase